MSNLVAHLPDGTLLADGYDDQLVGHGERAGETIAVYDRDACIKSLSTQFRLACSATGDHGSCDYEAEAEEFFEYNTQRASDYIGAPAPLFITMLKGVQE